MYINYTVSVKHNKLYYYIRVLILEGPEDDSIGVETCCPKNSNIIIEFVVFD